MVNLTLIADLKPPPNDGTDDRRTITKQLHLAEDPPNGTKSESSGGTHILVSPRNQTQARSTTAPTTIRHNIINIVPTTLKFQI